MNIKHVAYRIHTPRLVLRCWEPKDAAMMKAAVDVSREHLRPWMSWAESDPEPLETTIQKIRAFRGGFDMDQNYVYGILNRTEDQVIGGTGLHPRVSGSGVEIGYWIHVDHVRQGYATEAAAALTKIGFELHRLDRIEIHCEPANLASMAIPRKLGYHHEATLRRRTVFAANDLRDSMIWTLFKTDYPGSPAANLQIQAFDIVGNRIL